MVGTKLKQYECRAYLFSVYNLLNKSINQIAIENNVSIPTITRWIKKFNINSRGCDICGKNIYKGTHIKHYNLERIPIMLQFCTKACKINYIHQIQKKNNLILKKMKTH